MTLSKEDIKKMLTDEGWTLRKTGFEWTTSSKDSKHNIVFGFNYKTTPTTENTIGLKSEELEEFKWFYIAVEGEYHHIISRVDFTVDQVSEIVISKDSVFVMYPSYRSAWFG